MQQLPLLGAALPWGMQNLPLCPPFPPFPLSQQGSVGCSHCWRVMGTPRNACSVLTPHPTATSAAALWAKT